MIDGAARRGKGADKRRARRAVVYAGSEMQRAVARAGTQPFTADPRISILTLPDHSDVR